MIDNVVMLTLEKTDRRTWIGTGGLLACGVPFNRILYHVGEDGKDYSGTVEVLEAAVKDGFPKFQECLDDGSYMDLKPTIAAQFWSYMQICRESIEKNKIFLWIQDDMSLIYSFQLYMDLCDRLYERECFLFCLLSWWVSLDWTNPYSDGKDGFYRGLKCLFRPEGNYLVSDRSSVPDMLDKIPFFNGVLGGCDAAVIVTPVGAKWLIENGKPVSIGVEGKVRGWESFETWMFSCGVDKDFDDSGKYTTCFGAYREIAPVSYIGSNIFEFSQGSLFSRNFIGKGDF